MAKRGRPPKSGGTVYKRQGSDIRQVRYKDRTREMIRESAGTADREQAERGQLSGERQCSEVAQASLRRDNIIRHHSGSDRRLPDGASAIEAQNANEVRNPIAGRYQAIDRTSGIPGSDAYSERRGEAEATGLEPLRGAQGLGGDAEEGGRAVFRALRASAHLRHLGSARAGSPITW